MMMRPRLRCQNLDDDPNSRHLNYLNYIWGIWANANDMQMVSLIESNLSWTSLLSVARLWFPKALVCWCHWGPFFSNDSTQMFSSGLTYSTSNIFDDILSSKSVKTSSLARARRMHRYSFAAIAEVHWLGQAICSREICLAACAGSGNLYVGLLALMRWNNTNTFTAWT